MFCFGCSVCVFSQNWLTCVSSQESNSVYYQLKIPSLMILYPEYIYIYIHIHIHTYTIYIYYIHTYTIYIYNIYIFMSVHNKPTILFTCAGSAPRFHFCLDSFFIVSIYYIEGVQRKQPSVLLCLYVLCVQVVIEAFLAWYCVGARRVTSRALHEEAFDSDSTAAEE